MNRHLPPHRSRSRSRSRKQATLPPSLPPQSPPDDAGAGHFRQTYQTFSGFRDAAPLSLAPSTNSLPHHAQYADLSDPSWTGAVLADSSIGPYVTSYPLSHEKDMANIPHLQEHIRNQLQGGPQLDRPDIYGIGPAIGPFETFPDMALDQFSLTGLDNFGGSVPGDTNGDSTSAQLFSSSQANPAMDADIWRHELNYQSLAVSAELALDPNAIALVPFSIQPEISPPNASFNNDRNLNVPGTQSISGTQPEQNNPNLSYPPVSAIVNSLPPSTGSPLETHLLQIVAEQYRTIILLLKQRSNKECVGPTTDLQPPIRSGPGRIPSGRLANNQNQVQRNRGHKTTQMTQTNSSGAVTKKPVARSAYDIVSRLQTSETRDHAACIRCQRSKKRCQMGLGPSAPCVDCINVNPASLRIPCIRSHITDSILFRTVTTDNDTWTTRPEIYALVGLSTYATAEVKEVTLTHGFPGAGTLVVFVQSFNPVLGDVTSYSWANKHGQLQEMEMPHFAISQLEAAKGAIINFINAQNNIRAYLNAHLDRSDPLITNVFGLAWRRVTKDEGQNGLLAQCLRLWMASRLIETPWHICGSETLGMRVIDDPNNIFFGKIPVTPVMDTQLDQIVIKTILVSLRRDVLKQLQERILRKNTTTWFDVFAAVFILLNNIEIAVGHDHEFAVSFGHVTPGRGSRFEDYNLVEGYFHSAQGIIAHFRDAFHGQIPFSKPCTVDMIARYAVVDDIEAKFLTGMRSHVVARENHYKQLVACHKYERQMYWNHQLLYEWWDPSQVKIREKNEED